jgi:hypothetical protein
VQKLANALVNFKNVVYLMYGSLTVAQMRDRARAMGFDLQGATQREDVMQRMLHLRLLAFSNNAADAELDEFLECDQMRRETEGRDEIDAVLGKFGHEGLRREVLQLWHSASPNQSASDCARRAIATLRANAFSELVDDVSFVMWDNSVVNSQFVKKNTRRHFESGRCSAMRATGKLM